MTASCRFLLALTLANGRAWRLIVMIDPSLSSSSMTSARATWKMLAVLMSRMR